MPCLLLCSTASPLRFRRQSRKEKSMAKELAYEHKRDATDSRRRLLGC